MYNILSKKDMVGFNREVGEKGEFNNESSLDFALSITKTKRNWLYKLSYLVRSLLVDHVFRDGNKRTCLLVMVFYLEENKKKFDKNGLLVVVKKITKNNITNPLMIARLIYNVVREENKKTSRRK